MNPLCEKEVIRMEPGRAIQTAGKLPMTWEVFDEHFPDFPILPGILGLEILKRAAQACLIERDRDTPRHFKLVSVRQAKFMHALRPGDAWESLLELQKEAEGRSEWRAKLFSQNRTCLSAKIHLREVPAEDGPHTEAKAS